METPRRTEERGRRAEVTKEEEERFDRSSLDLLLLFSVFSLLSFKRSPNRRGGT